MHSKLDSAERFAGRIGREVLRERERLGMRQDEVALAAGVSTRVIHQIEKGKATSRLDSVVPVLEVLGLTLQVERLGGQSDGGGEP